MNLATDYSKREIDLKIQVLMMKQKLKKYKGERETNNWKTFIKTLMT